MPYLAWSQFDAPSLDARLKLLEVALELVGETAAVRFDAWMFPHPLAGPAPAEAGKPLRLTSGDRDEVVAAARRLLCGTWHLSIELHRPRTARWQLRVLFQWAPLGQRTQWTAGPADALVEVAAAIDYLRPSARKRSHQQVCSLGSQLFQLDVIQRLCSVEGVEGCRVLVEQRVPNPLSYRLVFHADPRGFLQDLGDVVELALRGGASFDDGRQDHEPLLTQRADSIDFCDRTREEINRLRSRLEELMPRLDAHELSGPITADLLRSAAARSGRYEVFEGAGGGLGVRSRPVENAHKRHCYAQFPVVFLDEFYLDLAELLLGR